MRTTLRKSIVSLVLTLVTVLGMFPTTAFASEPQAHSDQTAVVEEGTTSSSTELPAETPSPTAVPAEESTINSDSVPSTAEEIIPPIIENENAESDITDQTTTEELPQEIEQPSESNVDLSGPISSPDGSSLIWNFDPSDGTLFIGGVGDAPILNSADEQPWAAFRDRITEVHIDPAARYFAPNIAYWFADCQNLVYAEVPGYWFVVGQDAFRNCVNLQELVFLTIGSPEIASSAFSGEVSGSLLVMVNGGTAMQAVSSYPWPMPVEYGDFSIGRTLPYMPNGHCMNGCNCSSCSWSYGYAQRDADYHWKYAKCDNCSANEYAYGSREAHSFNSSGRCTICGYSKGGSGGGGGTNPPSCNHSRTRKEWTDSCHWKKYCRDCGKYLGSGVTHGQYSYGPWEYYNGSQHRSYYSCNDCGEGSYKYQYHSTQRKYSTYSSTQHAVREYCSTCSSYVGSTSYANHNYQYGNWTSYSPTQHRRTKTCSDCGYSTYEYSSHNFTYGQWENYNGTQHRRTRSCSCGYTDYEYADHIYSLSPWVSISDDQHQRSKTCSCGHTVTETGTHQDLDGDGYCDDCQYLMTRFSVTVPASLNLYVSETGAVYTADTAEIINRSTADVSVTSMEYQTANNWTIVPYGTNMANEPVDAKEIGFRINTAESVTYGRTEKFNLNSSGWDIQKSGSLPLEYDAAVSATSVPIQEQVLTITFILDWAK